MQCDNTSERRLPSRGRRSSGGDSMPRFEHLQAVALHVVALREAQRAQLDQRRQRANSGVGEPRRARDAASVDVHTGQIEVRQLRQAAGGVVLRRHRELAECLAGRVVEVEAAQMRDVGADPVELRSTMALVPSRLGRGLLRRLLRSPVLRFAEQRHGAGDAGRAACDGGGEPRQRRAPLRRSRAAEHVLQQPVELAVLRHRGRIRRHRSLRSMQCRSACRARWTRVLVPFGFMPSDFATCCHAMPSR
jgi:hypothetical protein